MKVTIVILLLLVTLTFLSFFLYSWYRLHRKLNRHIPLNEELLKEYKDKLPLKEHQFRASDGLMLSAWYVPVKRSKAVVILVHGYGSDTGGKTHMLEYAQFLNKALYSTFLLDMRSYGKSEGDKITLGVNEWKDVAAAFDYVKSLPESKNKTIGFLGICMGAFTTMAATGQTGRGDFIIAVAPYASINKLLISQVKKEGYKVSLFLPFLKMAGVLELGRNYDYYAAENMVGKINVPIYIISAKNDSEVDPGDGKYLFDLANQPKEYWQANTDHQIFSQEPEEFKKRILAFLEKYVVK